MKTLVYRCINLLASTMVTNYDVSAWSHRSARAGRLTEHPEPARTVADWQAISSLRVIHKESYHALATTTARALVRLAGEYINVNSIPKLKAFV